MELDVLSALLARPVSVYDLSARFPIGDVRRLEQFGFLCRVGDEYRITDAGRQRVVALTDQAQRLKDEAKRQSRQEANQNRGSAIAAVKGAVGCVVGWFFAHISPIDLFHKIADFLRSLLH